MIITLNGKQAELADGLSVLALLESKELTPDTVVVELNKQIIMSDAFSTTIINEGDHLEVLRFVGGG